MTIQDLKDKYPALFTVTDPNNHPFIGIYIEDGWLPLVDKLLTIINNEREISSFKDEIYIQQLKQKFGGLRCYLSKSTESITGAIRMAEAMSRITCEQCGNSGSMRNDKGYNHVACNSCYEK